MALTAKPKTRGSKPSWLVAGSGTLCRPMTSNCKIRKGIRVVNASMSSVKTNEKLVDRKPKGCFVKKFFKTKYSP